MINFYKTQDEAKKEKNIANFLRVTFLDEWNRNANKWDEMWNELRYSMIDDKKHNECLCVIWLIWNAMRWNVNRDVVTCDIRCVIIWEEMRCEMRYDVRWDVWCDEMICENKYDVGWDELKLNIKCEKK